MIARGSHSFPGLANINFIGYGALVVYLSLVVPTVIDISSENYYSSETQLFISALTGVYVALTALQTTKLMVMQYFKKSKSGNPEGILRLKVIISAMGACSSLILCINGHGSIQPDYSG